MRKSIIPSDQPAPADVWMNPDSVARVEVSSEEPEHPVEAALLPGTGWRASRPGPQTIRLVFDGPQHIRRIRLRFVADAYTRTQEFVLRWVNAASEPREIVRQQWNFSASGSIEEVEDYRVDLPGVIELELVVTPDISGGNAHASLAEMRVA
ncbi:carbohydrate-binding protein [Fimbriiglobus ruber]|uniref:carbohydrate-binding protein n=1 Tax=Fimbriiglobus ruber TaxID=1908690 RepID=UPI000B4B4F22|nr:carbohydrate-binding protein [Fimbriiglobus ruber]